MTPSPRKKVLLVGWDAADWEMMDPLLQSGQMPALAQLIGSGVRGNLATLQPILSPMLWTSIATGKRADKHGICGFTEPLTDSVGIGPLRSSSRKCKALWNILTQSGLKSNVIGWFATNPAEPINGVMVSDQFLRRPVKKEAQSSEPAIANSVHPPRLDADLLSLRVTVENILPEDLLPFIPRLAEIDLKTDNRPLQLAQRLARIASVQNLATALIQTEPWEFMGVYYDGIDQFGHEFMPYHPPQMDGVSGRDFELYQDVMRGCYRFHDMMLHTLLQYVDDQTTVILISDHGYECGRRRPPVEMGKKDPEGCHRPFGAVCLKGPNVKKNEKLYGASILDVTPTILTLLNLPIGYDMDGRPWLEALQDPIKPERIFSWEGVGDDRAGLLAGHSRQDPAEAAQAIEQLVELGYIAAPSDDARKTVSETLACNKTNLVRALLGTPQQADAIPLLQELIAANATNHWAVLTLADCHIGAGNVAEGRSILDALPEGAQKTGQIQLLFAQLAFRENKPDIALSHLQAAVATESSQHLFFNQLGWAFVRLRRWDDAESAFQKSLEADGDNPAAFDGLASVYLRRDEPEKAVENALQSVGLIHFFPGAHFRLGVGLQRLGKAPEAILAYETALGMGYRPNLLHHLLAQLYRPLNAEKADAHQQAARRYRRDRIFKADVASKLPARDSQA